MNIYDVYNAHMEVVGDNIVVMITPLPRNKRAKNPRALDEPGASEKPHEAKHHETVSNAHSQAPAKDKNHSNSHAPAQHKPGFANNPFASLEVKP